MFPTTEIPGTRPAHSHGSKVPRPECRSLIVLDASGRIEAIYPASASPEGRPGTAYALHATSLPGTTSFSSPFRSGVCGSTVVESSFSNGEKTTIGLIDLDWLPARLVLMATSPRDRLGVADRFGRYMICSDPSRLHSGEVVPVAALGPAGRRTSLFKEGDGGFYLSTAPITRLERACGLPQAPGRAPPVRTLWAVLERLSRPHRFVQVRPESGLGPCIPIPPPLLLNDKKKQELQCV